MSSSSISIITIHQVDVASFGDSSPAHSVGGGQGLLLLEESTTREASEAVLQPRSEEGREVAVQDQGGGGGGGGGGGEQLLRSTASIHTTLGAENVLARVSSPHL